MAIRKLIYSTHKFIPIATGCCEKAYICLKGDCAQLALDGTGFVEVIVENNMRKLGYGVNSTIFENPRCDDLFQYTLIYDDSLVEEQLSCNCIADLNTNYCAIRRLIELATNSIFTDICIINASEYPTPPPAGQVCFLSLVGHSTDPDGLYIITPTQKIQLSTY